MNKPCRDSCPARDGLKRSPRIHSPPAPDRGAGIRSIPYIRTLCCTPPAQTDLPLPPRVPPRLARLSRSLSSTSPAALKDPLRHAAVQFEVALRQIVPAPGS